MDHTARDIDLKGRFLSLDALRGLAILLMVLSGSIAFGDVMPAWMYHAQVPPPNHIFNPNVAGLTWVDLVFPLFLFSMGAAFPLALTTKLISNGLTVTIFQVLKRYVLLIFFAIFIFHSRAWIMSTTPGIIENMISVGCFFLLFLMFSKTNFEKSWFSVSRQILAFTLAILFLAIYPFSGSGFDVYNSDIIIIVLANMALFGSLIWIFTKDNPWIRVAILPLVMAILLSSSVANSWTNKVFNWSPIPWAYAFYYLKYLFIIVPGTFAGDWLLQAKRKGLAIKSSSLTLLIALLCFFLVGLNICLLFKRALFANLLITIFLATAVVFLTKRAGLHIVYQKFVHLGAFLLMLGLFFEPYEGGIKKDPSTYSYYFVCAGMAFLILFSLILLESGGYLKSMFQFMAKVGRNPMIAYTAGNLLLMPLLRIGNLEVVLNLLNGNAWGGFARGAIFTMTVALISLFFTNKRIFWKT